MNLSQRKERLASIVEGLKVYNKFGGPVYDKSGRDYWSGNPRGPSVEVVYGMVGDPRDTSGPATIDLEKVSVTEKGRKFIDKGWTDVTIINHQSDARAVQKTLKAMLGFDYKLVPLEGRWESGFGFVKDGKVLSAAGFYKLLRKLHAKIIAVHEKSNKAFGKTPYNQKFLRAVLEWGDTKIGVELNKDGLEQIQFLKGAIAYAKSGSNIRNFGSAYGADQRNYPIPSKKQGEADIRRAKEELARLEKFKR